MQFMLLGYGTGSRDRDGTAKQYRTLRGALNTDPASVSFEPRGVSRGDKKIPCIRIKGTTRKVSKDSVNNDTAILLHGLSEDEALDLASTFAEYALFLRNERDRAHRTAAFDGSAKQFAETSVKVLAEAPRDKGIMALLSATMDFWKARAQSDEKTADSLGRLGNAISRDNSKVVTSYKTTAMWRYRCIAALGNLLNLYSDGPTNREAPASLRLKIVSASEAASSD